MRILAVCFILFIILSFGCASTAPQHFSLEDNGGKVTSGGNRGVYLGYYVLIKTTDGDQLGYKKNIRKGSHDKS